MYEKAYRMQVAVNDRRTSRVQVQKAVKEAAKLVQDLDSGEY